jgi:hypothetical protein
VNLTAFPQGAGAWVFTGVVHDILEFVLPGDPDLAAAMRASSIDIGPISLQADSLNRGVSLAMGLTMVVVGVLLWLIAGTAMSPERQRRFGVTALGGSLLTRPGPRESDFCSRRTSKRRSTRPRSRTITDPCAASSWSVRHLVGWPRWPGLRMLRFSHKFPLIIFVLPKVPRGNSCYACLTYLVQINTVHHRARAASCAGPPVQHLR